MRSMILAAATAALLFVGSAADARHYTNSSGRRVHSPSYTRHGHRPHGGTARCGDGTWSHSHHHSGTCSHHGGVSH
jgi:hypothetical protein